MRSDIELLAPVGSFDALVAAVQNGANAVYLGGKEFSARASANNFDRDEMVEAVKYCHIRGVRVFVTVNTIIKENEVEDFLEYVKFLYMATVDAVILQDIGMARLIHSIMPDFELHSSTQMTAHSLKDVLFLKEVGFKRVVLARELDVDEIEYIANNSGVDIEVFVHGALCVSYSGQCLMSSMLGTRSGNRGRCAQPCRQKYKILNVDDESYVTTDGEYLLSPRDLMTLEHLGKIIETNTLSLKIEGRMKRPEYVANVVSTYRRAIDRHISKKKTATQKDIDELYSIFNRRFTEGYILKSVGDDNMNRQKPANQGLLIGEAISFDKKKKKLRIKLLKPLKKGDALNIGGGNVGRIIHRDGRIDDYGDAGEVIDIDFVNSVKSGSKIYKTSDKDLLDRMKSTYESRKEFVKIGLDFYVRLRLDEPISLVVVDEEHNTVEVFGSKKAEKAIKVAIGEDRIGTQLSKLNDTPFEIRSINFDIEDGLSLPISEINELRRKAIEEISNLRIGLSDRDYLIFDRDVFEDDLKYENQDYELSVSTRKIDHLRSIIDLGFDTVYYKDIFTLLEATKLCKSNGKKIYFDMPRIIRNSESEVYDRLLKYKEKNLIDSLDGFRVSIYGEILFLREHFKDKKLRASQWMNMVNTQTKKFYDEMGFETVSLSQEASLSLVKSLRDHAGVEYKVYGRVEMMISEYCPMGVLTKDCRKNKRDAHCSKCEYALESSDNRRFRLSQDIHCRTTIYSDEVINLLGEIDNIKDANIKSFYIDLEFESSDEARQIVEEYLDVIKYEKTPSIDMFNSEYTYTDGYLYKEID